MLMQINEKRIDEWKKKNEIDKLLEAIIYMCSYEANNDFKDTERQNFLKQILLNVLTLQDENKIIEFLTAIYNYESFHYTTKYIIKNKKLSLLELNLLFPVISEMNDTFKLNFLNNLYLTYFSNTNYCGEEGEYYDKLIRNIINYAQDKQFLLILNNRNTRETDEYIDSKHNDLYKLKIIDELAKLKKKDKNFILKQEEYGLIQKGFRISYPREQGITVFHGSIANEVHLGIIGYFILFDNLTVNNILENIEIRGIIEMLHDSDMVNYFNKNKISINFKEKILACLKSEIESTEKMIGNNIHSLRRTNPEYKKKYEFLEYVESLQIWK